MERARSSKRGFLLQMGFVLPIAALAAFGYAQEKTKPVSAAPPAIEDAKTGADKSQTAGQKYKNIRILQTLPAADLLPKMREYNAALNVQCSFCHVVNAKHDAWNKDDNPMKGVARQMIGVVNGLNAHQPSLNGQATCYMCHHGHPEPVTSIPLPEERK